MKTLNCTTSIEAELYATGGGTYLWSDGAPTGTNIVSPTVSTVYTVTVTGENGCKVTSSTQVTVDRTPPVASAGIDQTAICGKPSVNLVASGGGTYVWNTTETTESIKVTPTVTTTYTV
ncbi:MAG: hypothetical protein IPQ18_14520 [Saprospiraceae bacterium]|nr:hypothetical protein [Saprospiraceae bacterium]